MPGQPRTTTSCKPASAPADHRTAGRGIALAIVATIAYAVVDTLSKYQAREYPVGMIVWARYALPLAVLALAYLPRRGTRLFRTAFPGIHLARGALLTAGTVCIVFAYRVMPIAEAQAISFIHPVLLTLLAVVFLRERVSRIGWTAVLLGFSGVLIIVRPGGGLFTPAALLPLGLAVCYSSYQMLTRVIAAREDSISSLVAALAVGSVVATFALPFTWADPTPRGALVFALIGVSSGVGHYTMIKALEFAPASLLAPFAYVQLLWVTLLGMLVFGDFPDAITVIGMVIVVAGGLLMALARRAPRSPAPPCRP